METELLAPCNKCPTIADKEFGIIAGASVMLFKTYNGSSRYVYQVSGRNVAVIQVVTEGDKAGKVTGVYALPDYINSGLFRKLWYTALRDYRQLRLGDELSSCIQVLDLIHEIKNIRS